MKFILLSFHLQISHKKSITKCNESGGGNIKKHSDKAKLGYGVVWFYVQDNFYTSLADA